MKLARQGGQMKRWLLLAVTVALIAVGVLAQTVVDQGAPGTQGCWPVCSSGTTNVSVGFDGGWIGSTSPVACGATIRDGGATHQIMQMGVAAQQVPSSPSAGRVYVNVCNSVQNTSTILIKCRADGTAPVYAAGSAGDVLLFGDCVLYTAPTTANTIQCITNVDAGNYILTYECVP